jgi:hypothetical protein
MNSLLIFLIIIIIFSILYLYFRNYQHRKILESFSYQSSTPTTQSSLSTYYQNNTDPDTQKNPYNAIDYETNLIPQWTGIWVSQDRSIACQIIQINDQLTITFTNNPITISVEFDACPPNSYIGLAKLNQNKSIFYLNSTICDTYTSAVLNPTPGQTSGVLNGGRFTLYQTGKQNITFLLRSKSTTYGTTYQNALTSSTTFYPTDITTEFDEVDVCRTGDPCKVTYQGISDSATQQTLNNLSYNSCATSVNTDGTCSTAPSCVFYYGEGNPTYNNITIPRCSQNYQINGTLGFVGSYAINNLADSSRSTCNVGRLFGTNAFNSCILCYISNVGNVATLNYQFFGTSPNESSLTVQYDIMNQILNSQNTGFSLNSVRSSINLYSIPSNDVDTEEEISEFINSLSFTNTVYMNNTVGNVENLLSNSLNTAKNIVNSYIATNSNNSLMPAIWQINQSSNNSSLSSCPFVLSTSNLYNTPVKYVEYNLDGTTNLSLYGNGDNQIFLMDNINLIGTNSRFALATLNIKTTTSLYLIPSQDNNGFSNNSNLVNLTTNPEINGKWLMIGFNLNSLSQLNSMMSSTSNPTFYNMPGNFI